MTEPATSTPTAPPQAPGRGPLAEPAQDADAGLPSRTAGGVSLRLDHDEVSRDVRAKRPNLLNALVHARALERATRVLSLLALDFVGVLAAIFTALAVKDLIQGDLVFSEEFQTAVDYVPFVFTVTVLLFARSGLYGRREMRPGFTAIVAGLVEATFVSLVFALVNGLEFTSYYIFYGGLLFGLLWVTSLRWLYEEVTAMVLRALGRTRRAILVGTGTQIDAVSRALLADTAPTRYQPIGFISLTPGIRTTLPSLGSLGDLPDVLDRTAVHEVIIADPDFPQEEAFDLVDRCHERGVAVRIAPTTMEIMTHHHELVPGQSVPLFELKAPVFEGMNFVLKRTFDFAAASFSLMVLSPLLVGIAIAIKATSHGPVLYRSRRPGIGGQPFDCLKFRTMHSDAEHRQEELEGLNEASGALFKIRQDPRVTGVGRALRRFSLDELPQLINVLRGEMSMVGPRPLPMRDYQRLAGWHRKRYLVLPGITGLWQVSGRAELDFDELVRLDFLYLERWSVFLDLSIVLKTIPAVLRRRGAF